MGRGAGATSGQRLYRQPRRYQFADATASIAAGAPPQLEQPARWLAVDGLSLPQQPALEHGIRQRWLSGADRLFPEQLIDSQSLTFNSLIHPDDREDVWRAVQLGVDELQVFSIEYRLLCSDGSEKRVLERGCGIYSDAGDPLGLEGVVLERL